MSFLHYILFHMPPISNVDQYLDKNGSLNVTPEFARKLYEEANENERSNIFAAFSEHKNNNTQSCEHMLDTTYLASEVLKAYKDIDISVAETSSHTEQDEALKDFFKKYNDPEKYPQFDQSTADE